MQTTEGQNRPALPVGKIVCVGRNYAEHAKEMGAERPAEPILFLKPPTALLPGGGRVVLPQWSREVHHEVEIVVRLGRGGKDLAPEAAGRLVDACAVGLDLTARDIQAEAKKKGQPWAVAKGWDGSAPVSTLSPVTDPAELAALAFELRVNGVRRQSGRAADMIWSIPELLSFISGRFTLEPGDLVFTGTPSGVGPIAAGDRLEAALDGRARLAVDVASAAS